jgi:hypothetical protein
MYCIVFKESNMGYSVLCQTVTGRVMFETIEEAKSVIENYLQFYSPTTTYGVLNSNGYTVATVEGVKS